MRLTRVLLRKNLRWLLKQKWKYRGVINEPSLILPKVLEQRGIELTDPVKAIADAREPPVQDELDDPRFMPNPGIEDHPEYHEEPVYDFSVRTRLLEGEKQALLLTKSQPFYHLPKQIEDLIGQVELPHQDMLVQRCIMQANIWDPTKDKLPRRLNKQLPGWRFKAESGIPYVKRNTILLRNLIRMCQMLGAEHQDLMQCRRLARDHYVSAFYYFQGDKRVQIRGIHDCMMTTNRALSPLASEDLLDQSVNYTVPDIFPLAPTIDLKQEHIWRLENITGWNSGFSHPYPHTLFINNFEKFTTSVRNAKSLMFCFAHCLAFAKQKYGWDVEVLPEPITMQCISTDGETMHFTCFQLNTLNFNSLDGVKNLVWFDNDNLLYNKIIPARAMLRNTKYEDYDPEVFRKMIAMYINGAKLNVR